jgi:hypothetical protein
MVKTMSTRVLLSKPCMHLVLLLLMVMLLTGCGVQFPFYCEDDTASICYLQRRPIFGPREKPTSTPTSERRDGERSDVVPWSPLTKTTVFCRQAQVLYDSRAGSGNGWLSTGRLWAHMRSEIARTFTPVKKRWTNRSQWGQTPCAWAGTCIEASFRRGKMEAGANLGGLASSHGVDPDDSLVLEQ